MKGKYELCTHERSCIGLFHYPIAPVQGCNSSDGGRPFNLAAGAMTLDESKQFQKLCQELNGAHKKTGSCVGVRPGDSGLLLAVGYNKDKKTMFGPPSCRKINDEIQLFCQQMLRNKVCQDWAQEAQHWLSLKQIEGVEVNKMKLLTGNPSPTAAPAHTAASAPRAAPAHTAASAPQAAPAPELDMCLHFCRRCKETYSERHRWRQTPCSLTAGHRGMHRCRWHRPGENNAEEANAASVGDGAVNIGRSRAASTSAAVAPRKIQLSRNDYEALLAAAKREPPPYSPPTLAGDANIGRRRAAAAPPKVQFSSEEYEALLAAARAEPPPYSPPSRAGDANIGRCRAGWV